MVKWRGIEIAIVSQFDIRRLPEFRVPSNNDPFESSPPPNETSVASCYVPIYPGSQIWFEYSIEGPHPPKASYFFKIFHNETLLTSFDCTAKQ